MTEQHHGLRAFGSGLVNGFLHLVFTNAEGPVGRQPARIGNRRVRKGLTNDGDAYAIHVLDHIRLEDRITKVAGFDVLRQKVNLARKVFVHNFLDARFTVSEVPVAGHDLYAQKLAGVDHVLTLRPQRGSAALPGVTTVQQQRAGARCLELLDQCGHVRKAANGAVLPGRAFKVQIRKRMRFGRARPDLCGLQQVLTDQMRQLPPHRAHTQVDGGFAKVAGQQLGMAVGHVQQMHIAGFGQVIQSAGFGSA